VVEAKKKCSDWVLQIDHQRIGSEGRANFTSDANKNFADRVCRQSRPAEFHNNSELEVSATSSAEVQQQLCDNFESDVITASNAEAQPQSGRNAELEVHASATDSAEVQPQICENLEFEVVTASSEAITTSSAEAQPQSGHDAELEVHASATDSECTEVYSPPIASPVKSKKLAKKKREVNQRKRLSGEEYVGYSRSKSKIVQHNVNREQKSMKSRCEHKARTKNNSRSFRCSEVSEKARQQIHGEYWALKSWGEKKAFVKALVDTRCAIRRRKWRKSAENKKHNKMMLHDCYLRNDNGFKLHVCKTFLINTLCMGNDQFRRWTYSTAHDPDVVEPGPEMEESVAKVDRASRKDTRREDVSKWLDLLPKVPSHYCRSSSSKLYVESTFRSYSHMHAVYCDYQLLHNPGRPPVSRQVFVDVMQSMKIDIHSPRKDQCDVCCSFKTGNITALEYNKHIVKKDEAREAKSVAKHSADTETVVLTMDLQSVLLSPRLKASAVYYKQKLQIHNFTIYRLNDSDVNLYVWHEGNGGVTANEFVSCIVHYVKALPGAVKKLILISDGCGYQNRNRVLSSAMSDLAKSRNITIEQLVLEKGHTMMEADSVHSTLEQVSLIHSSISPSYTHVVNVVQVI